jgi:hypothetical protein
MMPPASLPDALLVAAEPIGVALSQTALTRHQSRPALLEET